MSQNPSRREFLSVVGSASVLTVAGCSGDSGPRSTETRDTPTPTPTRSPDGSSTPREATDENGTATPTPGLEPGTISTTSLPEVAGIIPQVDPLVVSAWRSPGGGISVLDPAAFEGREDTLRYNAVNGRLAPTAMAAYLLSRENAPLVGPLWASYLEDDITVEWSAVIGGVSVMYSGGIGLSTIRNTIESLDVEYETVTDSDSIVILRGPDGDIVGVTSDVFAFVPTNTGSVPFSPVDRVTALLETAVGRREPLPGQDPLLHTTLRRARMQGIVQLTHSQDAPLGEALPAYRSNIDGAAFSVTGDATGYESARTAVCQIDGLQDAPIPATATIGFDDAESIDRDELVANVGNLGVEREYVRDGDIVRVGCEYPTNSLSEVLNESSLGV